MILFIAILKKNYLKQNVYKRYIALKRRLEIDRHGYKSYQMTARSYMQMGRGLSKGYSNLAPDVRPIYIK